MPLRVRRTQRVDAKAYERQREKFGAGKDLEKKGEKIRTIKPLLYGS